MATGAFARSAQPSTSIASFPSSQTSTPIPPYNRQRKRGRPFAGSGTDTTELRKRQKPDYIESEAIELLIASIKSQASQESKVGRVLQSTVELAIQLLQNEYELRLSESHFLMAITLLESESKAAIFITLKSRLRDQWLSQNAGIELLNDLYNELNF
jgi:hypothetical protein